MKNAIILYLARGRGFAYAISFPKQWVESFRTLFSRQEDRSWQGSVWCFKRAYLEAVRAWATELASAQGLVFHDLAGEPKARREQQLAAIWQQEHAEHVAAMVELLPKLPSYALSLTSWSHTSLMVELTTYLEKTLFEELRQAALPSPIKHDRHEPVLLFLSPDPQIIRALLPLRIGNFQVQPLTLQAAFANGTAHFLDRDGLLWFGAPYMTLVGSVYDLYASRSLNQPYMVTEVGETIYQVVRADTYLERYCLDSAPSYVSSTNPPPTTEPLVALIKHFSLAPWLCEHVSRLLAVFGEALTPWSGASHMERWRQPKNWKHPADFLLHYLALTECASLLSLLGWDEKFLEQTQTKVQEMKLQRARDYYSYCQKHAVELMQELLRGFQRAKIQELAARYGLMLPLQSKEKMIQRCTDLRMAEDLIGITEERQRRSEGELLFADGIIWGQRDSRALYDALWSGYLSDGTRALSSLEGQMMGQSYVLWEDWASRKEKRRGLGVHTLLKEEGIEDLSNWRWFVFRSNEERPRIKEEVIDK
ncbi:MAG TPA: hypothetical protein VFA10_05780 [Ktedonobacteraceae bacterium]|nr:hypothetical protein [Ktedonobacteraceae bacterium]